MILGIDPGKHGALCAMTIQGEIAWVYSFTDLSSEELAGLIYHNLNLALYVFIENVTASPQQGVVSAFTFGKGFGVILGALYSRPKIVTRIRPSEWQGALGCLSGGSKKSLLEFAKKCYPKEYGLKIFNQSSADAVLLARYGYLRIKSKEK